jgi:sec-independent protein translocase protein TatA
MGLDSPLHIILLLAIVLLIFGAKRLPEIGRSLGSGLRGFKESINEEPSAATRALEPASPEEPPATGADPARPTHARAPV